MKNIEKIENDILKIAQKTKIKFHSLENPECEIKKLAEIQDEIRELKVQVEPEVQKKWRLEDIKSFGLNSMSKAAGVIGLGMRISSCFTEGFWESGLMDEAGQRLMNFGEKKQTNSISLKDRLFVIEFLINTLSSQINSIKDFCTQPLECNISQSQFLFSSFDQVVNYINDSSKKLSDKFCFQDRERLKWSLKEFVNNYGNLMTLEENLNLVQEGIDLPVISASSLKAYCSLLGIEEGEIEFNIEAVCIVLKYRNQSIDVVQISQACSKAIQDIRGVLKIYEKKKRCADECLARPSLLESMIQAKKLKLSIKIGFWMLIVLMIIIISTDMASLAIIGIIGIVIAFFKRKNIFKKLLGKYYEFVD